MFRMDRHGQCLKKTQYFRPVPQVPACEFSNDERMADNMGLAQQRFQPDVPIPQMRHPH
jgi:hypothetical protein